MPCAIGSTPCVAQSSAPAISACDIGEVPWNCDHSILYFLPKSGKRSGRRIIQYFASSAGMVQPTRMVGTSCAFATETSALAASSAAITIRFMILIPWFFSIWNDRSARNARCGSSGPRFVRVLRRPGEDHAAGELVEQQDQAEAEN